MKPVTGYMTTKGEFFQRNCDAEEQEAADELYERLSTSLYSDHIPLILTVVRCYPKEFQRLAAAHMIVEKVNEFEAREPTQLEPFEPITIDT